MTAPLFIAFSLAWFMVLGMVLRGAISRRAASLALGGLALWVLYSAFLAYRGVLRSDAAPPRVLLIGIPLAVFLAWLSRGAGSRILADALSLRTLTGLQSFRVLVEVFLDQLWKEGLLPEGMTWHGHNFDIATGITAFLLYLAWNRLPHLGAVLKAWNVLGLLLLAQVVVTGVLSAPGPQQILNRETPNLAVVSFPYVLVATLFVMSAAALHILSLRKLALASVRLSG
jgi:hypothetical protein